MATKYKLPPSASALSASMRDIGYSLETAIADIIDNSIAAKATEVDIYCDLTKKASSLVIIDNGYGMSKEDLLRAMKHGSFSPKKKRSETDLGRFGLGLKTASFSQCRRLTVASAQKSSYVGAEWDLDAVEREDDWIISVLNKSEIQKLPYIEHLPETGTIVIWRKLDKLFDGQHGVRGEEVVYEKLDFTEKHLALVFHRFLSGEIKKRKKLTIRINGHSVEAFDPFCRANTATRKLPPEKIVLDGENIRIQPYILPHHSKLSASEYAYYQDRSDFLSNQGVYIYRNGRLMAWGDWFRLVPKGEATKLARVQIDFTNAQDQQWTIDIKKSRARLPYKVRERAKQIINRIAENSVQVYKGRGKKLFENAPVPVWERFVDRKRIRYELNREHPLLKSLQGTLTKKQDRNLEAYVMTIISSLPVEMIYSDYSEDPQSFVPPSKDHEETLEHLHLLYSVLAKENKKNQCQNF